MIWLITVGFMVLLFGTIVLLSYRQQQESRAQKIPALADPSLRKYETEIKGKGTVFGWDFSTYVDDTTSPQVFSQDDAARMARRIAKVHRSRGLVIGQTIQQDNQKTTPLPKVDTLRDVMH